MERADERIDANRTCSLIEVALNQLTHDHREVLLLFAGFDLSYDEIARALGTPIGTIRSRLSRARAELREVMDSNGLGQQREVDNQQVRGDVDG